MKAFLLNLITLIFLISCKKEIPSFSQFEGKWCSEDGSITEQWQSHGDSVYIGKSFMIENNDTLLIENITIKKYRNYFYYIPRVLNQNEGREIPFKLMDYSKSQFIFENPSHDFPQRIAYHFIGNSKLLVAIESLDSINRKRIVFKFEKQPE